MRYEYLVILPHHFFKDIQAGECHDSGAFKTDAFQVDLNFAMHAAIRRNDIALARVRLLTVQNNRRNLHLQRRSSQLRRHHRKRQFTLPITVPNFVYALIPIWHLVSNVLNGPFLHRTVFARQLKSSIKPTENFRTVFQPSFSCCHIASQQNTWIIFPSFCGYFEQRTKSRAVYRSR